MCAKNLHIFDFEFSRLKSSKILFQGNNGQNKEAQKDPFHGFQKRLNKRLRFCWCRKSDQKVVTFSDIILFSSSFGCFFFKIYLLGSIVTIIEWVQFICSTAFQYGSHDFVAAVARRIISVSQWQLTMELDCPIETALLQLRAAVQKCFTNVLGKSQESQIQLGHHQKKCIAFSDGSAFLPTLIGRPYYDFCTV